MQATDDIKGQTLDEMLNAPYQAALRMGQERRALMNRMTGYQRGQAMKACKGDIPSLTTEEMHRFANLQHPNALKRKYA